MGVQAYGPAESDKRYEVVVKHYLEGVLYMAYFDELNKAHSWLLGRWAKLPVGRHLVEINCGAAIHDQREDRKRVLVMGAAYLTNAETRTRSAIGCWQPDAPIGNP